MALQLSDIISAARNWNPRFEHRFVPNRAVADFLTGRQRELLAEAAKVQKEFLTQRVTILFDAASANAVGTAGVGTGGAFPATVTNDVVDIAPGPGGAAVAVGFTDPSAIVLVAERFITSADATSLTTAGVAWTLNGYANKYVRITAGTGAGQERLVASNTTTGQVVVTQAWDVVPDATSLFQIVDAPLVVDQTKSAVLALPVEATERSYLVRLDAGGNPYIDYTKPLVATFMAGIALPPHHYVLGGHVRFKSSQVIQTLWLQGYENRLSPVGWPAAWIENGQLFLCGQSQDWPDASEIELRYVPIAPAFTALTDYVLLPDTAFQTLVTSAAAFMAARVNALPDVGGVDEAPILAQAATAEARWLSNIALQKRGRMSVVREVW